MRTWFCMKYKYSSLMQPNNDDTMSELRKRKKNENGSQLPVVIIICIR